MITIGQLASYAGVTVRAVRHYHRIGLLPEPERDASGYRTYDAAAVVRLIKIRTLAGAGVPLARVQDLLEADPEAFAAAVHEIDDDLQAEIHRLEENRARIARLAAGDQLALPESVAGYLDRLRSLGVDDRYLDFERDGWILVSAQLPDGIDAIIEQKHAELDDPDAVALYLLLSDAIDWGPDDPRIEEVADLMEQMMIKALANGAGEANVDDLDDSFVALLDAATASAAPGAERLLATLEARGWKGWTRIERVPDHVELTPPGGSGDGC